MTWTQVLYNYNQKTLFCPYVRNYRIKNKKCFSWENLKEVFHIENQKLLDMLNESEKEVECIKEIMKNNASNKDIILDLQSQIQQLKTEIFVIPHSKDCFSFS